MSKFVLAFVLLFSIPSFSKEDVARVQDVILKQLLSSPFNYATQKHTDIIFNYGTVELDLDNMKPTELDFVRTLIDLGQFVDQGIVYDVFGVEWKIKRGLDHPRFVTNLNPNKFEISAAAKGGDYTDIVFSLKRKNFASIPEINKKRAHLAQEFTAAAINRITHSEIAYKSSSSKKVLHLKPAKTCTKLF